MRRDGRLDVLDPVGLEPLEGSGFVQLHQSAVAGDIRGEDGGELPFHERAVLSQHHTLIRVETRLSKLLGDRIRHFALLKCTRVLRHTIMMKPRN